MPRKAKGLDAGIPRRAFIRGAGALLGAASLVSRAESPREGPGTKPEPGEPPEKRRARVQVAFAYPPSARLKEEGYYSWPGSGFDAEGRERVYRGKLRELERELGIELAIEAEALDDAASVERFLSRVAETGPDALLLVPFKKSHWDHVARVVEEAKKPTIVLATLGVVLIPHVHQLYKRPGVRVISAQDDFDAVSRALRAVRAAVRLGCSRIVNIDGAARQSRRVPAIGTEVLTVPHERFYAAFRETRATQEVRELAAKYGSEARAIAGPSPEDVLEAAKAYFALRRVLEEEKGDALMMNCLPGLRHPRQHVPPCMGFLSLRDEGVPMGCESDLDATLTQMLIQELFDRPSFQHNPFVDTERNLYLGAHCTAPSRIRGKGHPAVPYSLMTHAEAGWGCVPRVHFPEGERVAVAKYLAGEAPKMLLYSGTTAGCPPIPPAGGCRTNVAVELDEPRDPCEVKGHHLCLVFGDVARDLRIFCQLFGIQVL